MLIKVNSIVQLLNWLVTGSGVIYTIFIQPELGYQWWIIARIGILVQFGGFIVDKLERSVNRSWVIVSSIVLLFHLLIWIEAENILPWDILGSSMQLAIMSILISNLLFAYTISFVIKGVRTAFAKK